jgi:hypothetical protein
VITSVSAAFPFPWFLACDVTKELYCNHGNLGVTQSHIKHIIYGQMLFDISAIFMCRYNGLAVIYSVHKTMQLRQSLNEVLLFMHGKAKQMKSISGALSRH